MIIFRQLHSTASVSPCRESADTQCLTHVNSHSEENTKPVLYVCWVLYTKPHTVCMTCPFTHFYIVLCVLCVLCVMCVGCVTYSTCRVQVCFTYMCDETDVCVENMVISLRHLPGPRLISQVTSFVSSVRERNCSWHLKSSKLRLPRTDVSKELLRIVFIRYSQYFIAKL